MLSESKPTGGRLQLLQEKLALRATESLKTKWALELRDLLFQQNSQLTKFKLNCFSELFQENCMFNMLEFLLYIIRWDG